ncbi:hypothetical protein V6N13_073270 [Hibiscus sabdariffa]
MPLGVALEMAKMVWIALSGWVCSCLTIADEVAASLRSGDIGPFHSYNTLMLEKVSYCRFLCKELLEPLLAPIQCNRQSLRELVACPAAGCGAGLLTGKEKRVLKEGRRIEKKEPRGGIRRSMGIEKAKTTFNFIHWRGMQSLVIDFLKFQYAVKCCISLIMLLGH